LKALKYIFITILTLAILFIIILFVIVYTYRNPTVYNSKNDYTAYFLDNSTKKPIEGLRVRDKYSNTSAMTDSKGYFLIKYDKVIREFIVFKDSIFCDTLWVFPHPRQGSANRYFIGEKIYLKPIIK